MEISQWNHFHCIKCICRIPKYDGRPCQRTNPVAVQDLLLVYACFVEELYRLYLERTTLKAQTLHLLFCLV